MPSYASQTVEDDDDENEDTAGGHGLVEAGNDGEAVNDRMPLADLMRGELVGVNCDFSAVIEVQVRTRASASAVYAGV